MKPFISYRIYYIKNGMLKKTGQNFIRPNLKLALLDARKAQPQHKNTRFGVIIENSPPTLEDKKLRYKRCKELKLLLLQSDSSDYVLINN